MGKVPGIADVASLANVSKMTVSRFINKSGYVSDDAAKRVQKAIAALKYRPNQLARSLQSRTSGNIALILGNMSSPSSAQVLKGIESVTFANRYNLLVGNTNFNAEREEVYIDMLLRKQIDGLLLAPSSNQYDELRELMERGIALGFLFREIPNMDVDVVRFDVEHNSCKLIEHLITLGHRRIGFLARAVDMLHGQPYFFAYSEALLGAGLSPDPDLVVVSQNTSVRSGMEGIAALLALPSPPTAVFTTANLITGGVLRHCEEQGIRIPQDLMLVSADTFGELQELIHPTITRMELPMYELGRCAAEMLLRRAQDGGKVPARRVLMRGEFIQGESTAQ